jgi:hypothetical protein
MEPKPSWGGMSLTEDQLLQTLTNSHLNLQTNQSIVDANNMLGLGMGGNMSGMQGMGVIIIFICEYEWYARSSLSL